MATDKEVAEKAERVKNLRKKISQEERKAISATNEASNDIKAARLDAEEKRLQEELKATQNASSQKQVNQSVKDQIKSDSTIAEVNRNNVEASEKE